MASENAKLVSTAYVGEVTLEQSRGREYFMVQAGAEEVTVSFGNGNGELRIPTDGYYEPYIAPSTKIVLNSTSTYVVITNT